MRAHKVLVQLPFVGVPAHQVWNLSGQLHLRYRNRAHQWPACCLLAACLLLACLLLACPGLLGEEVPEDIFSDDGRLFGMDEHHLEDVLDECIRLAASSGGMANVDKVKAFKVVLRAGKLALVAGSIDTAIGPLPFSLSGLKIVKAPALMNSDLAISSPPSVTAWPV